MSSGQWVTWCRLSSKLTTPTAPSAIWPASCSTCTPRHATPESPTRYTAALGELGLASYRQEVRQRRETGGASFAAKYAEEGLAVLDGDVERIVRLLGGNFSAPYQFIRLAEAMEELGRDDDVLAWATRGIAETTGWQVAQLYDLAAGVYARRGEDGELLALRRPWMSTSGSPMLSSRRPDEPPTRGWRRSSRKRCALPPQPTVNRPSPITSPGSATVIAGGPLPFDAPAARAFDRVATSLHRAGRK